MEAEQSNTSQPNGNAQTPSQSPPIGSFAPAQPQYQQQRQQDTTMSDAPRPPITPQTQPIRPISAASQYYPSHSPNAIPATMRQTTPILPPMRQTTPILPPGMSRTTTPHTNNTHPVTSILPPQAHQPKLEPTTSNPGSRAASVHPESGPKMPEKAPAHGAPARQYLNSKVTGALLEGMKILAKEQ